ncbi:hypothetical protein D9M69_724650 [compost metagenome]
MSTLYSLAPVLVFTRLFRATVMGWLSPLANTTPKRKSFQIWVNCQIRQTMMVGTDIGSRMRPKMVKNPAPSSRAARTRASGTLT